jgi:xanthine/uracil/vitamin C permease (AzgA family)
VEHEPTSAEMTPQEAPTSAAFKLFDIRLMIGGLFTVYGLLLFIYSFFMSPAEIEKAAGININFWLGLGMLVLGLLFLLWVKLSPLKHVDPSTVDTTRPSFH